MLHTANQKQASFHSILSVIDHLNTESVRFANIRFLGTADCPMVVTGFTPEGYIFAMEHRASSIEDKLTFFALSAAKFAIEGVDRFSLVMRVWTTRSDDDRPALAADREEMLLVLTAHGEALQQVLIPIEADDARRILGFGCQVDRSLFVPGDERRPSGVHDLLQHYREESVPDNLRELANAMYDARRIEFSPGATKLLYN